LLTPDEFVVRAQAILKRAMNAEQQECVKYAPEQPLMIVAGPGSGKTTVLVLRALRHVLVDGLLPEQVLITTFTRKAATEIRSRLLEWGVQLTEELKALARKSKDVAFEAFLSSVDVNRFVTGTLDSLCEDWLSSVRNVDEVPPVLVDGFAAKQMFTRQVFRDLYYPNEAGLKAYLASLADDEEEPRTLGDTVSAVLGIVDRLVYDRVTYADYRALPGKHKKARNVIADAAVEFDAYLKQESTLDFARLERTFLESVQHGKVADSVKKLKAILVDEYQDTNPLQEAIYFELVKRFQPSFTVVGDDDQSLYRFRGSTVELFRDFVARFKSETKQKAPQVRYLFRNYRSTPEVVEFFNQYVINDPSFQGARVTPPKPRIIADRASNQIPILGLFRNTKEELAEALAQLLADVFRNGGRSIELADGRNITLRGDPKTGNFGDAAFLAHTVSEMTPPMFGNPASPKFPLLLREACMTAGIQCFNPRGQALRDIGNVQLLLGLMLECLDGSDGANPEGRIVPDVRTTMAAKQRFAEWRAAAAGFIRSSPKPNRPHTLADFVRAWQIRKPIKKGEEWPSDWPLLELCFTLISWIPPFQNDPEHQVYLEAITRTMTQAAGFSPYRTLILNTDRNDGWKRSRAMIILDVLAPIAENIVEVDEEILPSVPRDRLNLMTVHQAKGLEFPLVMVDVASAFTRNHPKNRFRRFPDQPSRVHRLEAELAPCSPIGTLRMTRADLDRAFEDLVRLYYVAYSRAQDAMLLVGLDTCLKYTTTIKHVATWWRKDETWAWRGQYAGKKPPVLCNKLPINLIT
jgi:DNA helicase-2/ATP-dependent DNA helicase PcrA